MGQMQAVLEDCAAAAQSSDARDKYFVVSVKEYEPAAATGKDALALESAASSLGATLSELSAVFPDLPACSGKGQRSMGGVPREQSMISKSATRLESFSQSNIGVDVLAYEELLSTAKAVILEVR